MYAVFLVAEDGDYCKAQDLTLPQAVAFVADNRDMYDGEVQYLEIRRSQRDMVEASDRYRGAL